MPNSQTSRVHSLKMIVLFLSANHMLWDPFMRRFFWIIRMLKFFCLQMVILRRIFLSPFKPILDSYNLEHCIWVQWGKIMFSFFSNTRSSYLLLSINRHLANKVRTLLTLCPLLTTFVVFSSRLLMFIGSIYNILQTIWTQIKLLPREQSDQGLYCSYRAA